MANVTCRDSARLCCVRLAEKLALVAFRLFPRPLWFHATVCYGAVGEGTSMCRFKSVPTCWLRGRISAWAACYFLRPERVLVLLLSSLLSKLSGEIYLRLKPYLVVKISSDIVTEHCCQVCVLSMMFCRSATVFWHGKCMSDWAIRLLIRIAENHVVWLNSGRPTWDIKIFFTFDFHILH